MEQFIMIIPLLVLVPFYLWMFRDMTNNETLVDGVWGQFQWPPRSKTSWTLAFIFLNVFAAALYYVTEYRHH